MAKQGFDNGQYLKLQSQHIQERIAQFGGKLYLEFGGKLFDDYHASRVLPGFEPDSKIRMLQQLQIRPKIRFATSDSRAAIAMVRAGLGITLLNDILTADLADGVAVLPLDPPQSVHLGIALPEEEHVSPAAKRFITYALNRLPELDVL